MNYNTRTILILFGVLVALVISSFFVSEGFETGITGYLDKIINNKQDTTSNQDTNQDTQASYYNHFNKQTDTITTGTVYTGPNGNTIRLTKNTDGSQSIVFTDGSNKLESSSANVFVGPNGNKATIITTSDGKEAIKVETPLGTKIYTINTMPTTAQYYGNTSTSVPPTTQTSTSNTINGDNTVQGPNGIDYSSSLPPGIPANQIPSGQEDLYILKSQVVPPVCPVCPANCPANNSNNSNNNSKCQPCKPCWRCPEPSMTCKAVPNYGAIGGSIGGSGSNSLDGASSYMPVLSDFSSFGM